MDTKKLEILFKCGPKTLIVGSGQPIGIVSVEGLESSEYIVHTGSNAVFDGSTTTGKKVDERLLHILLSTRDMKNKEVYRDQMIHFFNPKYMIQTYVNYCGKKGMIEGEILDFDPTREESLWDPFEVMVTIKCPDPFFSDLDNFGKNIAANTPMFAFPLSFLTFNQSKKSSRGQVMSYTTLTSNVVLFNRGDVETGLEVIFIAKRGAVTNPKITNLSTGEFIEIYAEMEQGDEIRVNTNVGKKNIYQNGNSIYKQKNKLSTFFELQPGDNTINYTALENETNLDVRIFYTPKYLGV